MNNDPYDINSVKQLLVLLSGISIRNDSGDLNSYQSLSLSRTLSSRLSKYIEGVANAAKS